MNNYLLIIFIVLTSFYLTYFVYRFFKLVFHFYIPFIYMICVYFLILYNSRFVLHFLELKSVIYLHVVAVSFILEIFYILLKKYKIIQYIIPTGLLCCLIVSFIFGYGYYRMNHIVEKRYVVQSNKIDDFKIALISDMHMGISIDQKKLKNICQDISKQNVDIVVLDGDIFDENTSYDDMKLACQILGTIQNQKGIYYVFGNHDSNHYTSMPAYVSADIEYELEKNHIIVLNDETVTIDHITIIGRGDAGYYQEDSRLIIEELYTKQTQNYVIVLDHQPLDLQLNASLGVDLQLSGHTHGGQFFPQGLIQKMTSDTLVYGQRQINGMIAITTSGISGWRYPFKTGANSEYVIIEVE